MAQQIDSAKLAEAIKTAARIGSAAPAALADAMGVKKSGVRRLAKHPDVIAAARRGSTAAVDGAVRGVEKAAEKQAAASQRAEIAHASEDEAAARLRSRLISAAEEWLATPKAKREYVETAKGALIPPDEVRMGIVMARDRGRGHDARRAIERRAELERDAKAAEAKPAHMPTGTVRIIRVAKPHLRIVPAAEESA